MRTSRSTARGRSGGSCAATARSAWDVVIPRPEIRADAAALIGDAFEDQLGLTLERTTGPWDVIVIDDVRMPSPN